MTLNDMDKNNIHKKLADYIRLRKKAGPPKEGYQRPRESVDKLGERMKWWKQGLKTDPELKKHFKDLMDES